MQSDNSALDETFRSRYERVARTIGRVIHDQARAEELAVDVFLKWWRNPQAHGEHTEGWLYRTAVHAALDEWRRQARRTRVEKLFSVFRDAPATPELMYSVTVQQQNVRSVLGRLRPRDAAVLLLQSEGLTYREIASSLRLNPASVGRFISRAQELFRKEYVKRYGNES